MPHRTARFLPNIGLNDSPSQQFFEYQASLVSRHNHCPGSAPICVAKQSTQITTSTRQGSDWTLSSHALRSRAFPLAASYSVCRSAHIHIAKNSRVHSGPCIFPENHVAGTSVTVLRRTNVAASARASKPTTVPNGCATALKCESETFCPWADALRTA
jgi:hypothetical protein